MEPLQQKGGTVALDSRYQHDPNIVGREIAGEVILVPIRNNVNDLESIYTLNETAARIWELLDGERTLAEVRDAIVAEFEVEADEAEADLVELVAQLESIEAVRRVE
ncbi:MAG: PqqD family protein [Anaerolineae bacterium]